MIMYNSDSLRSCSKCGFSHPVEDVFKVKYEPPAVLYLTGSTYPQNIPERLKCTCMRCGFSFEMEIYKNDI